MASELAAVSGHRLSRRQEGMGVGSEVCASEMPLVGVALGVFDFDSEHR